MAKGKGSGNYPSQVSARRRNKRGASRRKLKAKQLMVDKYMKEMGMLVEERIPREDTFSSYPDNTPTTPPHVESEISSQGTPSFSVQATSTPQVENVGQKRKRNLFKSVPEEGELSRSTRLINLAHFFNQLSTNKHELGMGCTFTDMFFVKEIRVGLYSSVEFYCRMCNTTITYTLTPETGPEINAAVVSGSFASGIGYATTEELFAAMNLPFMSRQSFQKMTSKVQLAIEIETKKSMAEAAEEERKHAIATGSVAEDGTPIITVVADGAWGKRSYRTKYDSLSGMASIIGYHSKKVLFAGIKNKFCALCYKAKRMKKVARSHNCFQNWSKPSTAMEAQIILEGFKKSVETHGLIYGKLIGDNDSSVTNMLTIAQPYGPHRPIKKIQCRNHLLRNLCSHLRKLKGSGYKGHQKVAVSDNILRIRRSARGAIQHWKKAPLPLVQKVRGLTEDLSNVMSHVFGDHTNCRDYFCKGQPAGQQPLFLDFQACGLFDELNKIMRLFSKHAESLLEDVDSNICEGLNSTINKQIGGKRIFYGARGSYNIRVLAAVLQFNRGSLIVDVSRVLSGGETPGSQTKKFVANRKKKLEYCRSKKRLDFQNGVRRQKIAKPMKSAEKDSFYGCAEPLEDVPSEELENLKLEFMASLRLSDVETIELETRDQSSSSLWWTERRKRLTASKFANAIGLKKNTCIKKRVFYMLYKEVHPTEAMRRGQDLEGMARQVFCERFNKNVQECGLFIDKEHPFLAASPGGIVLGEDAIIEIKCPAIDKYISIKSAIEDKKIEKCFINEHGEVGLRVKNPWYYQVQGQLNITKRKKCYFIIYSPNDLVVVEIERDMEWWDENLPKLKGFYDNALLPEIVSPLFPKRTLVNDIRPWIRN